VPPELKTGPYSAEVERAQQKRGRRNVGCCGRQNDDCCVRKDDDRYGRMTSCCSGMMTGGCCGMMGENWSWTGYDYGM
jgi:hypothetical protein